MGHHVFDLGRWFKLRFERCTEEEYDAMVPEWVRDKLTAYLLCQEPGPEDDGPGETEGGKIAWCVASCSCEGCAGCLPMTTAEMRTARRCIVCQVAGGDRSSRVLRSSGWFRVGCFPPSSLCSAHTMYCDCVDCCFASEKTQIDAGSAVECGTLFCEALFHEDHVPHSGYCSGCADPEDVGADSCVESKQASHTAPTNATSDSSRARHDVALADDASRLIDALSCRSTRKCMALRDAGQFRNAWHPHPWHPRYRPLLY